MALAKDCLFSFSKKPLTLATNLGIFALLVGLAWGFVALTQVIFQLETADLTAHYMIVSSHLLAGSTLVAIGILGEYTGRIWEQVRSRPNYLLKFDSRLTEDRTAVHQPPHIRVFDTATDYSALNDQDHV